MFPNSVRNACVACALVVCTTLLVGCIPPSGLSIDSPQSGDVWLKDDFANKTVVISYGSKPGGMSIYLNGQSVTQYFEIGGTSATAPFADLEDFIVQGVNQLSVNPLTFGPSVDFTVDSEGPKVVVKSLDCGGQLCDEDGVTQMTVTGVVSDASAVKSVRLQVHDYDANLVAPFTATDSEGYPMGQIGAMIDDKEVALDGNEFSVDISKGDIYVFTATDAHGYVSETRYLASGQEINPIFKMRIGSEALDALKPTLSDGMSNLDMTTYDPNLPTYNQPLAALAIKNEGDGTEDASTDVSCDFNQGTLVDGWKQNCTWDGKEGKTVYFHIGEFVTDDGQFNQLGVSDSKSDTLNLGLSIADNTSDDNDWGTKVKLRARVHECKHDLYTEYKFPQVYWFTRGIKCTWSNSDGLISLLYAGDPEADGYKYATIRIGTMDVDGDVAIKIDNGALAVDIGDIDFDFKNLDADGPLGPILGLIPGIVELIVGPIIQGTLNNALKEFKVPLEIISETNATRFSFVPQAFQVYTDADNNAGTPQHLYMYYTSAMTVDTQSLIDAGFTPSDIAPVLGSYYVDAELPAPSLKETNDSNFELTVSSNFINQAFLALYQIGMTHMAILGDQVFFGPTATDDMGSLNNQRIRLIPNGPGTFRMRGDQTSQASLEYVSAELAVERKTSSGWKQDFAINVDIKAGVLMHSQDNKFYMTIQQNPEFKINSLTNNTGLPISDTILQAVLDTVIRWAIPLVAETALEIQLPPIKNSDGSEVILNTKSIEAVNQQHLGIGMEFIMH